MTGSSGEQRIQDAEALFASWASQVEAGEEFDFEELVRANAEFEPELRALHDDWKRFAPILGNVVPGLIASGDGLVLPSLTRGPDADEGPPSDELLAKLGIHAPDNKRYRFRARIGQGGGGVVLKVWDSKLNRPLAMKLVLGRAEDQPTGQTPRVDGRRLTRFVDEARIASQLNHPGIVPVHELGADETGRAFFTMKLVKGDDLARIFEKVKRGEDGIGLPRAVAYLLRVCEAMAYAHDRGVIHRDLKPANVMVGAYGEVHVMDWGLARVVGDSAATPAPPRTRSAGPVSQVDSVRRAERSATPNSPLATEHGDQVGTPCYMSPEQARGDVDAVGALSDVYAVGAMLYQLLTGTPPYVPVGERGDPYVILRETKHGPPLAVEILAPRAIPELVAICERAMARDPAARYASIRFLAADLQAFIEGHVVSAYETGAWAETKKWVTRNTALAIAIGAALLVTMTASMALYVRGEQLEATNWRLESAKVEALRYADESASLAYFASIRIAEAAIARGDARHARRMLDGVPEARKLRWEWKYLDAQSDTSLVSVLAELGYGGSLIFNRDASKVAAELDESHALIFDAVTGTPLLRAPFEWPQNVGALSPSGTKLMTIASIGYADDEKNGESDVGIWDIPDQRLDWKRVIKTPTSCAFSSDGGLVVAEYDSTPLAWNVLTGEPAELVDATLHGSQSDESRELKCESVDGTDLARVALTTQDNPDGLTVITLVGHVQPVAATAISDDGRLAATASSDSTIRVWDATSSRVRLSTLQCEGGIYAIHFSPDGNRILIGGSDGMLCAYDSLTLGLIYRLVGHDNTVHSIQFSPDGRLIATAAGDSAARVWDVATGRLLGSFPGAGQVWSARFSPDGRRLLTSLHTGGFTVWDVASGASILTAADSFETSSSPSWTVEYSPDGRMVVVASGDLSVRLYDAADGAVLKDLAGSSAAGRAHFMPDGRHLLTIGADGGRLWDSLSGQQVRPFVAHPPSDVSQFAWFPGYSISSDGRHVVIAYRDHTARVFDVASGAQLATLRGHRSYVYCATFFDDNARVVTTSFDGTVRVWDWIKESELLMFPGLHGEVTENFVAVSPDSSMLIAGGENGVASIWSTTPHRASYVLREAATRATPEADARLDGLLSRLESWSGAWDEILTWREPQGSVLQRVTQNRLSQRASSALTALRRSQHLRVERIWVARMCGLEEWPDENAVRNQLLNESFPLGDPAQCHDESMHILLSNPPSYGEEMRALILARSAVDGIEAAPALQDFATSANRRVSLGCALFRAGRFVEARAILHTAVNDTREYVGRLRLDQMWPPDGWSLNGPCSFCGGPQHGVLDDSHGLERSKDYIDAVFARWQDDSRNIRLSEWMARIAELDREIAAIEADPDVRIWLREQR